MTGSGAGVATAQTASSDNFRGVVELFTSQGCASCPPADAVLAKFSDQSDIVALSYNVDYWDYIGWKDQLASRQNTDRQKAYAKAFNTSSIYTPQIVVNGTGDFIGTHAGEIRAALEDGELGASDAPRAHIQMSLNGSTLAIEAKLDQTSEAEAPVLILVAYQDHIETAVSKGENSGHRIENHHAVHDFRIIGSLTRPEMTVEVPVSTLGEGTKGKIGYAALLQMVNDNGVPGSILAAVELEPQSVN
ncbi:DUF1223 domain-containing protein [Aureimonas fodinaquatilis]|uniref:DUF1223 domain-containing protein n=2 Tax=Aureimonas fodinaquatilis TaxID=2565783 RepID=A0A5B0DVK9_9HYPH|nr:DUF1223 domain-containing protein [Aureimonas fodinaquatilis]